MKLRVVFDKPGRADGEYRIRAKDCVLGVLFWGDENGVLPDWSAIAYVPLRDGVGSFFFTGGRAVPREATRVCARLIDRNGGDAGTVFAPVPPEQKTDLPGDQLVFCCMSDLHFGKKNRKLDDTLSVVRHTGAHALLLTGDLVNDGGSEQLRRFDESLVKNVPIPVFPAPGNHDLPPQPEAEPFFPYAALENAVLDRAGRFGADVERVQNGLYLARFGSVQIAGVACVSGDRKFKFPAGVMDALESRLSAPSPGVRRIVLCHAPLLSRNPQRNDRSPYLNLDRRMQLLFDLQRDLILLSGHLHYAPNGLNGNVQTDPERGNLFISLGSVCPNTAKWTEPIVPDAWSDGVYTVLSVGPAGTQIQYRTLSGQRLPRGYYVFCTGKEGDPS